MANEVRKKLRAAFVAQASAAITADAFSGGTETPLDNTYDGGSENCLGADHARMSINVTAAPSSEAIAEIWTAKNRGHDSEIGKMRPTSERIVRQVAVARRHYRKGIDQMSDRVSHRAQMNWNVRSVGDQFAVSARDNNSLISRVI